MPWHYDSKSGLLRYPDGKTVVQGYAGHGVGLNNPDDEYIANLGPLPHGMYLIGAPFTHPHCGPISMRLTPAAGTEMRGRAGMLIHGDSATHDYSASTGCIVLARPIRMAIAMSEDRALIVTHWTPDPTT